MRYDKDVYSSNTRSRARNKRKQIHLHTNGCYLVSYEYAHVLIVSGDWVGHGATVDTFL